jgi:hypothetical protein
MLWCIENLDDAGEGMFLVDARDEQEALSEYAKKHSKCGCEITSVEQVAWIDLATVSGERGETYYFERQREAAHG